MSVELAKSLYTEFQETCQSYLPVDARERLDKAYRFAYKAHQEQRRDNGDLYITHPLTVALYLAKLYMDEMLLTGALLHDVVEDNETVYAEDIEREFGEQARHLVEGVTHLKNVSHLEDIANLFLMASRDVRVVLIKLYDRLHNLRTIVHQSPERRRRKAQETLDVYVPLTAKLGMWHLKTEFETLILSQLDPATYTQICTELDRRTTQQVPQLEEIAQQIQFKLREKGLPCGVEIRKRGPYQIYQSLLQYRIESRAFAKAFYLVVLMDSLPQCYLALAHIHEKFPHATGTLVDRIGNPRDTFYRSIHTHVIATGYRTPVPLRIRTYEFDRYAELGVQAELQFATPAAMQQPQQAAWLPQLPNLYKESGSAQRFMESLFQDILQKQLTCFTPRGEKIYLPKGSTVLDFAYHVHTNIGHECRGGLINGQQVELSHYLADGDQIEIIRARRAQPSHEWLDDTLEYTTTTRAKRKIREWFRRQDQETQHRKGKEILRDELKRFNVNILIMNDLVQEFDVESDDQFFIQIGNGTIASSDLARAIIKYTPGLLKPYTQELVPLMDCEGQTGYITPLADKVFQLGRCCQPKVGEDIVAHVRENRVLLHRTTCRYILRSNRQDNMVRIRWITPDQSVFIAHLRLEAYDRPALVHDVTTPIAELGANILRQDSQIHAYNYLVQMRIKLEVASVNELIRTMHKLTRLPNIVLVRCMTPLEIEHWIPSQFRTAAD